MKRARERDARTVEKRYSTKPIRIVLGAREFRIPANYFGPKYRDEPDTFVAKDHGFGFSLFLPDFGGYTKDNWQEGWFHPQLISVRQVKQVDKNEIVKFNDGTRQKISPAAYGDPAAMYKNVKGLYEDYSAFKLYGLEGYRHQGGGATPGVLWTGTRSNGEFFFFRSYMDPGQTLPPGRYPLCDIRYYSAQEDLSITYVYPKHHLDKWREIDDAIWAKLHSWRVK